MLFCQFPENQKSSIRRVEFALVFGIDRTMSLDEVRQRVLGLKEFMDSEEPRITVRNILSFVCTLILIPVFEISIEPRKSNMPGFCILLMPGNKIHELRPIYMEETIFRLFGGIIYTRQKGVPDREVDFLGDTVAA